MLLHNQLQVLTTTLTVNQLKIAIYNYLINNKILRVLKLMKIIVLIKKMINKPNNYQIIINNNKTQHIIIKIQQ